MQEKRSVNLCSTYILPLVGLNQTSFGIGNFINSYVNETNQYVLVALVQIPNLTRNNPHFRFEFIKNDQTYCVFEIPKQFRETVELFREGKYSMFSEDAKDMIRRRSGLRYRVATQNGTVRTARELLALDKDRTLKKALEDELQVKIDEDAELASVPGPENFYVLQVSNELVS